MSYYIYMGFFPVRLLVCFHEPSNLFKVSDSGYTKGRPQLSLAVFVVQTSYPSFYH
jgi:hypothetical protein